MMRFHGISRLDGGKLDGIHLLWAPPWPTGHSLDGFTIFRRDARGEKSQHCLDLSVTQLSDARTAGYLALPDALVWAEANTPGGARSWTYRAELVRRHSIVTVTAGHARAAFIGTSDGTVIGGATFTGSSVTLRGSDIAIVWLVTDDLKSSAQICGDQPNDSEWAEERAIVKNLQVPFASVNPTVASLADGRSLAASRAEPEPFDGDFAEVTRYADAALRRPGGVPAMRVISERPGGGGNAWDVSPFGLAIAPTLLAPWRRGWGFSHLDKDGLTPGHRYDYRIVGTVPRRDRGERAFDFHTVPRGYRLPRHFRWGTALVWCDKPTIVRAIDGVDGSPSTIRKGIGVSKLTLVFDAPTQRVVLEALPGAHVVAKGFHHGSAVASVTAGTTPRTLLDFGTDVDAVVIEGHFALAGIVPQPIDPSLDPDAPVPVSQIIYDVEYGPTGPPPPPGTIIATNLSDPSRTTSRGLLETNRGFAIEWAAPPSIDPSALPFLPRSMSAPPTEVSHYILERAWAGHPFAAADGDGIQVSGRNASTATDRPAWGFDLLRVFPPADAAPSSYSELVHAVEVFEPKVLSYGDNVTYRVSSVDALGRRSTPRVSTPVPLRKHVRPPPPTTPPTGPVDPNAVPRSGVHVDLLQLDDPDITDAQRAVAGAADAVVIRWGWGPDQRDLDPDVTEFRVYRHGSQLTALDVTPAGIPSPTAGGWSFPVTFDRPVASDEFAGVTVVLGAAYEIIGHDAGTAATLRLAANPEESSRAPTPAPFTLNRTTSAELDSEYWDERVEIVTRTPAGADTVEAYEVVLPATWIATSAAVPRQRVAFGIAAADAESYIPDRRLAVESAPRAGNESTVAAAEVTARYFGRPTLVVTDLADVQAITLARQAGDSVHGTFQPADSVPAGAALGSRMLLERLPAAAALRRLRVEPAAISLISADGAAHTWALSTADAEAIRNGYAAGQVPDRFAAHAAARLDGLDGDSERLGIVEPSAAFEDTLPNRPARWLYRLRAIDDASHPSEEAQVLGLVLHVPSAARAVAPVLKRVSVAAGSATVTLDCKNVVGAPYVFLATDASLGTATATLATIRNRDDLAPIDRLVVRDAAGRVLPAIAAAPGTGDEVTATGPVPPGGPVLHAWALAVSPDGVPSRLVGPLHADAMTGA